MRIVRAWRNDGSLHFEAIAESDTEFVDAFTSQSDPSVTAALAPTSATPLTSSPRFRTQGRHAPSEAGRPASANASVKCPACGKRLLGQNGLAPHRASCPGVREGTPAPKSTDRRLICPECDFRGGAAGLAIHRGRVHGTRKDGDAEVPRVATKAPTPPKEGARAKAGAGRPLSSSPVALIDALVKGDREGAAKTFGIHERDLRRLEEVAANTTGHSGFTAFGSEWGLVDEHSRSEIATSVMKAWQEATP